MDDLVAQPVTFVACLKPNCNNICSVVAYGNPYVTSNTYWRSWRTCSGKISQSQEVSGFDTTMQKFLIQFLTWSKYESFLSYPT